MRLRFDTVGLEPEDREISTRAAQFFTRFAHRVGTPDRVGARFISVRMPWGPTEWGSALPTDVKTIKAFEIALARPRAGLRLSAVPAAHQSVARLCPASNVKEALLVVKRPPSSLGGSSVAATSITGPDIAAGRRTHPSLSV